MYLLLRDKIVLLSLLCPPHLMLRLRTSREPSVLAPPWQFSVLAAHWNHIGQFKNMHLWPSSTSRESGDSDLIGWGYGLGIGSLKSFLGDLSGKPGSRTTFFRSSHFFISFDLLLCSYLSHTLQDILFSLSFLLWSIICHVEFSTFSHKTTKRSNSL